jgi:hypothetical protein
MWNRKKNLLLYSERIVKSTCIIEYVKNQNIITTSYISNKQPHSRIDGHHYDTIIRE